MDIIMDGEVITDRGYTIEVMYTREKPSRKEERFLCLAMGSNRIGYRDNGCVKVRVAERERNDLKVMMISNHAHHGVVQWITHSQYK